MKTSVVSVICGVVLGVSALASPVPAQANEWYAIAASSNSRGDAQRRANYLGAGWFVMRSSECPNFRPGLWIAASGPHSRNEAQAVAGDARAAGVGDAYAKSCF